MNNPPHKPSSRLKWSAIMAAAHCVWRYLAALRWSLLLCKQFHIAPVVQPLTCCHLPSLVGLLTVLSLAAPPRPLKNKIPDVWHRQCDLSLECSLGCGQASSYNLLLFYFSHPHMNELPPSSVINGSFVLLHKKCVIPRVAEHLFQYCFPNKKKTHTEKTKSGCRLNCTDILREKKS